MDRLCLGFLVVCTFVLWVGNGAYWLFLLNLLIRLFGVAPFLKWLLVSTVFLYHIGWSARYLAVGVFVKLTVNVLQLPEGGDFEALQYQTSTNFDRSTKLHLTTEPPLLGRCCW
jgi:hypothetical protein